jgi:hypothetical protein
MAKRWRRGSSRGGRSSRWLFIVVAALILCSCGSTARSTPHVAITVKRTTPASQTDSVAIPATTTASKPQTYSDCISEAGADAKRFGSCAALLTPSTCRQLLRIESGSVSCATAMTLANGALLLSLQTGSTGYIHIGPWECYAGAASTDCTYGRTQFIAQTGASSSSTASGTNTSTSSTANSTTTSTGSSSSSETTVPPLPLGGPSNGLGVPGGGQ